MIWNSKGSEIDLRIGISVFLDLSKLIKDNKWLKPSPVTLDT